MCLHHSLRVCHTPLPLCLTQCPTFYHSTLFCVCPVHPLCISSFTFHIFSLSLKCQQCHDCTSVVPGLLTCATRGGCCKAWHCAHLEIMSPVCSGFFVLCILVFFSFVVSYYVVKLLLLCNIVVLSHCPNYLSLPLWWISHYIRNYIPIIFVCSSHGQCQYRSLCSVRAPVIHVKMWQVAEFKSFEMWIETAAPNH